MTMSKATRIVIERAMWAMGSRAALARKLGISRQAMDQWEKIPARHVLALESMSGVSRYDMRPDVFGKEPPPRRPNRRPEFRAAI